MYTRAERLRTTSRATTKCATLHLVSTSRGTEPTAIVDSQLDRLQLPEAGIGNREAAAVLGQDPFKSQIRLWMEKTGRQDLLHPVQLQDDSLGYWGRLLEPIVAAHYTHRTGRKVRQINATLRHPKHPWMLATATREVMDAPDVQLLECLCIGMDVAPLWANGVPDYIRLRVMHLLAVTGQYAADVVVLLGGRDLQIYRIEREEAEISRLIKQERVFWRAVESDRAPPARDEDVPMQ
ncbi:MULTISPECIES: YqaJ viral recombinase family protein [unclassified Variovorax]|uniref:YqaJ viral recombinase family nuclease n=1 Tax=unclassified Variovorax TaxID=663243 RepID=UPI0034E97EFF